MPTQIIDESPEISGGIAESALVIAREIHAAPDVVRSCVKTESGPVILTFKYVESSPTIHVGRSTRREVSSFVSRDPFAPGAWEMWLDG